MSDAREKHQQSIHEQVHREYEQHLVDGLEDVVECVQRARRVLALGKMPLKQDREYLLAYITKLEENATRNEKLLGELLP